jgi:hypothetical protein
MTKAPVELTVQRKTSVHWSFTAPEGFGEAGEARFSAPVEPAMHRCKASLQ